MEARPRVDVYGVACPRFISATVGFHSPSAVRTSVSLRSHGKNLRASSISRCADAEPSLRSSSGLVLRPPSMIGMTIQTSSIRDGA